MCAACKIIIDGYGALKSSADALGHVGEVFCESLMKGREAGTLTEEQMDRAAVFSQELCDYAKELDSFRWKIIYFVGELAQESVHKKAPQ